MLDTPFNGYFLIIFFRPLTLTSSPGVPDIHVNHLVPKQLIPHQRSADHQAADYQPADLPTAVQKTADYQPADQPTAVQKTADQQPFQPAQQIRSRKFHYLNRALKHAD